MRKNNAPDDIDVITEQWQARGLETDFTAMQIAARLLRLSKTLETRIGTLHARFNLKPGEFDVLAALKRSDADALTPSALYQSMLLSSGAMTSRLDRLENKGLITRTHCTRDRRSVKVSLTTQGKALIEQVAPAHFQLLCTLLAGMTDSDKAQFANLLKGCLQLIEPRTATTE
ncbi:MarR family transcriptional regulator [Methylophaga sp.]|uniref:MarR family winged helix-turn-helix transcriptional regulator n=1 Tax=Methylophaga sp. TaxID=2024840 RepID=UPI001400237E|nr:MarR family transcriptional regulator [Methylophaga sp.]MTI62559.1 MarR family transcriptional regulator [Methylophaga sp.]